MNIIDKAATWLLSKASRNIIVSEYHKRAKGKRIDYSRQITQLHRKEVRDYINAVASATDPDNPRLGDWYRFRQMFANDDHLISCVENRYMPVQCAPFKLVDADGNEDEQAKQLLQRPWMLDLVRLIVCQNFEGVKLLCFFDLNEHGELTAVEEVPQTNFIPQRGIVIENEYDEEGTSYRTGVYANYYLQVGNDWSLGDYSGLATIVLAKKLALGAWLSYIDKYGVPPIFAITERMDTERRDELFEMLENFRMNHFAVLQGNEKIETPSGYNVDAYNTFKSLISDIADRAISKRLLGSSGLTDEKSFVGSVEAQERILQLKIEVDKLKFKYYFNTEVKPRLVKISPAYAPLENLTFEYDQSEALSLREVLEAIRNLSPYFEFDIEELVQITGLPITQVKSQMGMFGYQDSNDDNDKGKQTASASVLDTQKKKDNAFLIFASVWQKAIEDIIRQTGRGENADTANLNKDFILNTYEALNKSARNGYGDQYYNNPIACKIRQNLIEFSAVKTYVQQTYLQDLKNKYSDDKDFEDKARKYLDLQNGQYLNVQQAWTTRSAQGARQYQDWQRDKGEYPCVKFRTMGDERVRHSHAELEGLVVPVDSPLLSKYMTPLDYNCRCWWEQTTDKPTDSEIVEKIKYKPSKECQGNTGETGVIFNKDNSYADQIKEKAVRMEVRRQAELSKEYTPYSREIKVGQNKVLVSDFADPKDLDENIIAAKKIAKGLNTDVYIRHHINIDNYRNPEFGIGKANKLGDLKTYDPIVKNKPITLNKFLENSVNSLHKQKAAWGVLDISNYTGNSEEFAHIVTNKLYGKIKLMNNNIKHIVMIKGDKVAQISRQQIEIKDFTEFFKKLE